MEVSLSVPKVAVAKPGVSKPGFYAPIRIRYGVNGSGFSIRASRCRSINSIPADHQSVEKNQTKKLNNNPVELFVGLPLDTVSQTGSINYEKAIRAGLKALKLLGVHGVELPIFWAVAQPDSSDQFNWSSYLSVADMAHCAGLKLRVSLQFNGSDKIKLPSWVLKAAESDPDILFKDRSGKSRKDCLNFAVDELAVLDGKKPIEVFEGFCASFKAAFKDYFGSTITDISISLGPNGEFRYPNYPPCTNPSKYKGPGEFQCYDKYTLSNLKTHSERSNNPLWGLSGPHNVPTYNQSPESSEFFRDRNGSWETRYGDFFLSWYSRNLLEHGERFLSVAKKLFGDLNVEISAKIPFLSCWHGMRARAAELTAGFYNTVSRDGYDDVAELFKKYNCAMIISSMDFENEGFKSDCELLLSEIRNSCEKHGVDLSGESLSLVKRESNGFGKMKESLFLDDIKMKGFIYGRMGAEFFSPDHWPLFMEFVRDFERQETDSDDVASENGSSVNSVLEQGKDRKMQAV